MACKMCGQDRAAIINSLKDKKDKIAFNNAKKLMLACSSCTIALYIIYREETGLCEVCGQSMELHIKCYRCGISLGRGHESDIAYTKEGKAWCRHCNRGIPGETRILKSVKWAE